MLNKGNSLNKQHNSVITYILCYVQLFMEIIKEFENLTQLNKFEKQNKGKLKISNIDYDTKTKLWEVTFVDL